MKNVRSLVDRNLVERLNRVDNLSEMIYRAMNLPIDQHHIWAIRHFRHLTIMTDDSILATRLRLEQDRIMQYIKQNSSLIIDAIDIKMAMRTQQRNKPKRQGYTISEQNAKTIASIASGIEDPELREGLFRIIRKDQ